MATLTWRNVDAPDFRPAMEGVRNATTLLSNAFDRAGGMVDQFTQARTDAADRAVMQRMLGLQDPEAYKAALADGSLVGPQADRVSTGTLANLDSRVGSLLDRAVRQNQVEQSTFNLGRDRYAQDRLMSGNEALDSAAPIIQQAQILQRQGREDEATRLLSTVQGLRPDQYAGVLRDVDSTGSNALSRGQTVQNMGQSAQRFQNEQWRFGNERSEYGEARAGDALADKIAQRAPDAQTAAQFLDASGASAAVKQRALARLGIMGYQGVYGPVGSGGQPMGGAGPASIMTGGAALPDNIRTVGQFVDNKSNLLNVNPTGTATGVYQITADTWKDFAPKALGENWREANIRDPQVQDRVAEAIWDSAKNSPTSIRNRWTSLSATQAEQLKGRPWNEVRDIVSAGETSSRASDILGAAIGRQGNAFGTQQVNQRLAERASQNFAATGTTPDQYLSDLSDSSSAYEVAQRLRGEDSPLAGTSRDFLLDQIGRMVNESKGPDGNPRITPAQAGRIMLQSAVTTDDRSGIGNQLTRLGRYLTGGTPNLGNRMRLDDSAVDERLRQFLTGQTSTNVEASQSLGNVAQVVNQAQAAYDAAELQLSRLRSAGQGRPGYQASIQLAQAQRDAALQALRQAQGGVPADPTLVPTRDRTTPVPVDRPAGVPENATRGPLGLWWVSRTDDPQTRR